jgi:hypothetical protein
MRMRLSIPVYNRKYALRNADTAGRTARRYNLRLLRLLSLLIAATLLFSTAKAFACVNPVGTAGRIIMNEASNVPQYCNGTNWIAMTAPQPAFFAANAVEFDAASERLVKSTPISGASDSKRITGSFWIYHTSIGQNRRIFETIQNVSGGVLSIVLKTAGNNRIDIIGQNAAGTNILNIESSVGLVMNRWNHVLFSFDMSNSARRHIYINGESALGTVTTWTDDLFDFTVDEVLVGGAASPLRPAYLSEFWLDIGTYIDISVEYNRRKFIDAAGNPMILGTNGSVPTGSVPDIYLTGDTASWHLNKGAGGDFSPNSPITTAPSSPSAPSRSAIVQSGLVGHWRLDETVGAIVSDSSLSSNNGSFQGGMSLPGAATSGIVGGGFLFSGNNHIQFSSTKDLNFTGAVTVSAWVKPSVSNMGVDRKIFANFNQVNKTGFKLGIWNTNVPEFEIADGVVAVSNRGVVGGTTLQADEWYHLVGVYSDVGNYIHTYVNGVIDRQLTTTATMAAHPGLAFIGRDGETQANYAGSTIDDVRVYNRALSPQEITEIYQTKNIIRYNASKRVPEYFDGNRYVPLSPARGGPTDGLVGYWPLDEISGATAADISGNGNSGSMLNGLTANSTNNLGAVGNGLSFDGIDDYIEVPTNGIFNPTSVTVSGWIKLDQLPAVLGNDAPIIYADSAGSGYAYKIQVDDNGNAINFSVSDSGGTDFYVDSDQPAVVGRWYHVVGRLDAAYNLSLFVNGVLQADTANSVSRKAADRPLRFGESSGDSVLGMIDDLRIYNRALSDAEIQSLFRMGTPVGQTTALPQGCASIGQTCNDGTVYAGTHSGNQLYTTRCNLGQTWNGTACTGSIGTRQYKTTASATANATSMDDGYANMQAIKIAGIANHPAALACTGLGSDWYLPAPNEFQVLYNNYALFSIPTTNEAYWTSADATVTNAYRYNVAGGSINTFDKTQTRRVRCMRRGPIPVCTNPYGLEGAMIYNLDHDVVQYCDGARWIAIGK